MTDRQYFKVTLHLKGGGVVEFAAEEFAYTKSVDGSTFTNFSWTRMDSPDLVDLHSVIPSDVSAVTARKIRDGE